MLVLGGGIHTALQSLPQSLLSFLAPGAVGGGGPGTFLPQLTFSLMSSDQWVYSRSSVCHFWVTVLNVFLRPSKVITHDVPVRKPGGPDSTATDDSACHPGSLLLLRATQICSGLGMERKWFCCIQPPRYGDRVGWGSLFRLKTINQ